MAQYSVLKIRQTAEVIQYLSGKYVLHKRIYRKVSASGSFFCPYMRVDVYVETAVTAG